LSTDREQKLSKAVDNFPAGRWLGCVAPKRHARRAVTRNVLKRQMRAAAQRHEAGLAQGLWLVRLRQGFPVAQFPSADSDKLRTAARSELERLFGQLSA
jgi:ribonuclease P protein component